MRFHPTESPEHNQCERRLWGVLKSAFERDEGIVYYRYPVFTGRGSQRKEPDFVVVSRDFGVWVFECKGARINQVREIQGQEWVMKDWYADSMTPVQQAEDQLYAVKALVERHATLRKLEIVFDYRIALPFITQHEWEVAGWATHHAVKGVVLTADELGGRALRNHVAHASRDRMPRLENEQWQSLLAAFRGSVPDRPHRPAPRGVPSTSPARLIQKIERRLGQLDEQQEPVAIETPDGPQRIRGLAGTGKTVLFARRAARIHAAHPDWDIAFVFYSRSLYGQVRSLVQRFFQEMTGELPDFERLRIWHAWGAQQQPGFYREAALHWNQTPMGLSAAIQALGRAQANNFGFEWVCNQLEESVAHAAPEPFLDAVLIDEGQDLPPAFYRLAQLALRPPKRLYWAYDEAQGIGSQVVPRPADIFGIDESGRPVVDLAGKYQCGISKAHNLNRCYRTPSQLLTVAHAVNMGLLRNGGPLQGVTTQRDWHALGYIVEGDFSPASVAVRREVIIQRNPKVCGHPLDDAAFVQGVDHGPPLSLVKTDGDGQALAVITEGIAKDLASGLLPEDLLVITLPTTRPNAQQVRAALQAAGISAFIAGDNGAPNVFSQPGQVTIAHIFRAKGNEAWKVYVSGLHGVDHAVSADEELVRRNQVFAALTRARLWCVAIGSRGPLMEEMEILLSQGSRITFPAFNQRDLRRYLGEGEEGQLELEPESELELEPESELT